MLKIEKCDMQSYEKVRLFYHSLIDATKNSSTYYIGWEKDIYPSPEFLQESIAHGELYIGFEHDEIVAAMVLNHEYNESYEKYQWQTQADKEEIIIIHALGVHPDHTGKGYAKQLVNFAIHHAKDDGCKAIRLDVLKGNVPAEKLYTSMGFVHLHTLPMYYEDTGWTDYELYEHVLCNNEYEDINN